MRPRRARRPGMWVTRGPKRVGASTRARRGLARSPRRGQSREVELELQQGPRCARARRVFSAPSTSTTTKAVTTRAARTPRAAARLCRVPVSLVAAPRPRLQRSSGLRSSASLQRAPLVRVGSGVASLNSLKSPPLRLRAPSPQPSLGCVLCLSLPSLSASLHEACVARSPRHDQARVEPRAETRVRGPRSEEARLGLGLGLGRGRGLWAAGPSG